MENMSEQELEAGVIYGSEGGESGARKGTSSSGATTDTFSTPTEKEEQILIFQSWRQFEESLSEVSALTCYVRSHEVGRNDARVSAMKGCEEQFALHSGESGGDTNIRDRHFVV